MPTADWDHGAMGAANRVGLVVEGRGEINPRTGKAENPNGVTGVRRVDMLEVYFRRGAISVEGYNAGERLRAAWLRTEMGLGAKWISDRVDGCAGFQSALSVQIDRVSALARLSRAIGDGDRRIIGVVVYDGGGIGALPEYRGRRHQAGLVAMHDALDRLAERMEALRL